MILVHPNITQGQIRDLQKTATPAEWCAESGFEESVEAGPPGSHTGRESLRRPGPEARDGAGENPDLYGQTASEQGSCQRNRQVLTKEFSRAFRIDNTFLQLMFLPELLI